MGTRMKAAGALLFCLVSILTGSSNESDDLALKSQRAKEVMAQGKFAEAIPLYRELNQAVPGHPGRSGGPQNCPALAAGSPGRAWVARWCFAFARPPCRSSLSIPEAS